MPAYEEPPVLPGGSFFLHWISLFALHLVGAGLCSARCSDEISTHGRSRAPPLQNVPSKALLPEEALGCLPSVLFCRCRAGGLGAAEGFEAEEQADAEDEAEPVKALQADGRLWGV